MENQPLHETMTKAQAQLNQPLHETMTKAQAQLPLC